MRAALISAALGVTTSACACGALHGVDAAAPDGGDDAGVMDAPNDAVAADAWEGFDWSFGNDDGICRPGPGICNTDDDCVAWNAAVGPRGTFVSSRCIGTRCTAGVLNCFTYPSGVTMCACYPFPGTSGAQCLANEICVSDTAGGPTRCAQECVGR